MSILKTWKTRLINRSFVKNLSSNSIVEHNLSCTKFLEICIEGIIASHVSRTSTVEIAAYSS
ncbi:hypothetical protein IC582_004074 [Cucumis melo]